VASPPPEGLLGEDEEIVAGRHPVEEAFAAHRQAIRLLVVPQRRQALEKIVLHATNLRIPIVEVEGGTLTALAGFDGHQGIALVTDRRQFAGLDDLIALAIKRNEAPFVLVLDSLEDPQNFGSLLRTAEASACTELSTRPVARRRFRPLPSRRRPGRWSTSCSSRSTIWPMR
jgi:23S rRNA (guanosine2251-2'-O)-methyltransferase